MAAYDNKVLLYMKKLDISREEAIQLIADDKGEPTEEQKALEQKAKKNLPRNYTKSDSPRKKTERVRKVDEDKKILMDLILQAISDSVGDIVTKTETEINFSFNSNSYSIKVIKHRKGDQK